MANWLDKAVAAFAPETALKRERARAALTHVRSYAGAKKSRRTAGWMSSGQAANAEIGPDLRYLQQRSRELVRNNPYGKRAIDAWAENAVGTGIIPAWGNHQPIWDRWSAECDADGKNDFYGLQSLVERTVFESGECLVRFRNRRLSDGLSVPLQLQVIEPDFLDFSKVGPVESTGGFRIFGIEFDALGRRSGYWLFPQHPGEVTIYRKNLVSAFVPADQVLHVYEVLRPGQVRGVPRFAASMIKMRDLDDYEEAELVRKKIEACFAAFVTSSDPDVAVGTADPAQANMPRIEALEPGMVEYMRPGEDIKFGAPAVKDGYQSYTKSQLYGIAAGIGITYAMLTGDHSEANFSSQRAAQGEFRRTMQSHQWLTFIPQFCVPVAQRFVEVASEFTALPRGAAPKSWTPPRWEYVNPIDDIKAAKEAVKGGITSLAQTIRDRGDDPAKVFAEIKEERGLWKTAGLIADTDVGAVLEAEAKANVNKIPQAAAS